MEEIVRRGKANVFLWPNYAKAALIGWVLLFLLGIILLVAGAGSNRTSTSPTVISGAVILGLVTLVLLSVVGWVIYVRLSKRTFTPSHFEDGSPQRDAAETSRSQLTPAGSNGNRELGSSKNTFTSFSVIPDTRQQDDEANTAVLRSVNRRGSNPAVSSADDFWRESATLQRLPTANTVQLALENQGGLLQYADFQSTEETTGGASTPGHTSSQSTLDVPHSRTHKRTASVGEARSELPSSRSSLISSLSSSRHSSTDTLPKSMSSSHVNPAAPASRQRPRSSSTTGRMSSFNGSTLEAASQQLSQQQQQQQLQSANRSFSSSTSTTTAALPNDPANQHQLQALHQSQDAIAEGNSDVLGGP